MRGKIVSYFRQKLAHLKTNFLGFLGATVQWNCHCIKGNNLWTSHIGNGIKEH